MTILLQRKAIPVGAYAELHPSHSDDEVDVTASRRPSQMDYAINYNDINWGISVYDKGVSRPFEVHVFKNGKCGTSWDRTDQWDFVTMMNDHINQAELRGQHGGYAQHFDAIRIFAQKMVEELRPNEPINCYIPRVREFERPICNDPPEIVAHRRWVEERRNDYKRVFVGNGYR